MLLLNLSNIKTFHRSSGSTALIYKTVHRSSGSTALILAALIMHGFRPGPYLISETPEFVYAIFGAMLIANLGFLFIGLVGAKFFSLVAFIPK